MEVEAAVSTRSQYISGKLCGLLFSHRNPFQVESNVVSWKVLKKQILKLSFYFGFLEQVFVLCSDYNQNANWTRNSSFKSTSQCVDENTDRVSIEVPGILCDLIFISLQLLKCSVLFREQSVELKRDILTSCWCKNIRWEQHCEVIRQTCLANLKKTLSRGPPTGRQTTITVTCHLKYAPIFL